MCYKGRRPVVVMPEGSKTNGLGILNIERDIVDMIYKACSKDQDLVVNAIRFDHVFLYYSPYNSYDKKGYSNLFGIMK